MHRTHIPQPIRHARPERSRRDGWTPDRQLDFLDMLARTGSVTKSARAAGMSRESAYRLRRRDPRGLFSLGWARAMRPVRVPPRREEVVEGHIRAIERACGGQAVNLRLKALEGQFRDHRSQAESS